MEKFEWHGRCLCEVPERPASFGAMVCGSPKCRIGLEASAKADPGLEVVIKWGLGARTSIKADLFCSLLRESGQDITPVAAFLGRDVEPYTEVFDGEEVVMTQYVREIFVKHDPARDGAWD